MKNVRHRPCVICATGHFKCNAVSPIRTCSQECSKIYSRESPKFKQFPSGWYSALDIIPRRRSLVSRVGNSLMFRVARAKANKCLPAT